MRRSLRLGIIAVLVGLTLSGVSLAQVSPNFNLSWAIIPGAGGQRQSTNFAIQDTTGQWVGGVSSSASFGLSSGFWAGVPASTSVPSPSPTQPVTLTSTPPPPSTGTATPTRTLTPSVTLTSAPQSPTPTLTASAPGDAYEDDDACNRASPIQTTGVTQTHTFHDAGDADWIRFFGLAGKTYVIETFNPGPRSDAVVFVYDRCDAAPLSSQDNPFGTTLRLEFDSPRNTTYYLKFQQHDPSVAGADTRYDVSVSVDTIPPAPPRDPRASPDNQKLLLQWERPTDESVVGYRVRWGTQPRVYSSSRDVLPQGPDTTFYELTGLINGARYYLVVSSLDFSGNESDPSPEISAIPSLPPDNTAPVASITQPTTTGAHTTSASVISIGGTATDAGGNLSRARVRNLTTNADGWDYTLRGASAPFLVPSIPLAEGANQIQVTVYDDAGNTGVASITVQRLGVALGAVVIVAGRNETESLQVNINHSANRAYRLFRSAGYRDDDIYYLNPAPQDPNNDGTANEVDAPTTPAAVRAALLTWARGRIGPTRPLYLYMMDHGLIEAFCASGCAPADTITPADLNSWLTELETMPNAVTEVNVVIEACHAGSFIDRTLSPGQSISKSGRVVITSTNRENNAYASVEGAYFSDAFFTCLSASGTLRACFNQARGAVLAVGNNQSPWLDDNGDGLANQLDGTIAQERYVARFFGAAPPSISQAEVTVQNGTGLLTATVDRGDQTVALVWAAVIPPSFREPTVTTLELGLPVVRLEPVANQPGLFRASYPGGFGERGEYRVIFYAQDQDDAQAQPRVVRIQPGAQIFLPLIMKAKD